MKQTEKEVFIIFIDFSTFAYALNDKLIICEVTAFKQGITQIKKNKIKSGKVHRQSTISLKSEVMSEECTLSDM